MTRKHRTREGCVKKRYFPDELEARAAGMCSITEHDGAAKLWVYRCRECSGWHLTKRNNGVRAQVTATEPVTQPRP